MKLSMYNNFVPYEGKYIGHNGLSNQHIILEPELFLLLEAAKSEGNLDEVEKVHPDLYQYLKDEKFILPDDFDELQTCIDNYRKVDLDETRYELHINPTMNCNFKCWYCYETHIKQSKMTEETKGNILNFVQKLLDSRPEIKDFQLNWFGGEPLLYFNKTVLPIMEGIYGITQKKKVKLSSSFTSNGLLIDQNKIDLCKQYKVSDFQITLDGHRERHNQVRFVSKSRGSYDKISNSIKLLARNKVKVNVRINCSKETLDGLAKIADDFSDMNTNERDYLIFDFHKVWQVEENLTDNLNEYIRLFREKGFRVSSLELNTFGHSCYADKKNQALINYNGDVFKCSARDFNSDSREGVLTEHSEIIWNEKQEKRLNSKFKNKPCLECSILPICGGGCTQLAIENEGQDYCVYDFDENRKKQVVLDGFLKIMEEYDASSGQTQSHVV